MENNKEYDSNSMFVNLFYIPQDRKICSAFLLLCGLSSQTLRCSLESWSLELQYIRLLIVGKSMVMERTLYWGPEVRENGQ